jgi:hypothetical protein
MTTKPPGPVGAALAIVASMLALLRHEGRVWSCACGEIKVWSPDVWSRHCSQHLLDPYSITHHSHGLIFYWLLAWTPGVRRLDVWWRWTIAVFLAAAWEVAENSAWVIDRYRTATMSLDYLGDSVLNSVADVGCCAAGFWVARALGWKRTLALFAATELLLLWLIRDNLTLNVVMLLWPLEGVKAWQTAGH